MAVPCGAQLLQVYAASPVLQVQARSACLYHSAFYAFTLPDLPTQTIPCLHLLQVAFGPVARELVLYRHRAPECSFHGELPVEWTPPNAAAFYRSCTACHTSLLKVTPSCS